MSTKQIKRFSPHQTAKVIAVLSAVSSLLIMIPMAIISSAASSNMFSGGGISFGFILIMPIMYLIMGYISTFIGCLIYNFLYRFVGGIEIETDGLS